MQVASSFGSDAEGRRPQNRVYPDPQEDLKSRSPNLIYFLDPPGGLGRVWLQGFEGLGFRVSGLGFKFWLLGRTPESWNMALGGLVLGSLILYLKGMRIMMFQLSGFYCRVKGLQCRVWGFGFRFRGWVEGLMFRV